MYLLFELVSRMICCQINLKIFQVRDFLLSSLKDYGLETEVSVNSNRLLVSG